MSTFKSTRGGVMTVEVGSITGDLELSTTRGESGLEVTVRYVGADEWYTVEGSPVSCGDSDDTDEITVSIIEALTTPGESEGFNEKPCDLSGFSGH